MTLIGYWLVGLPVGWLLGVVGGAAAVGVWMGLPTGLATTTAVLLLRRYARALAALTPASTS